VAEEEMKYEQLNRGLIIRETRGSETERYVGLHFSNGREVAILVGGDKERKGREGSIGTCHRKNGDGRSFCESKKNRGFR